MFYYCLDPKCAKGPYSSSDELAQHVVYTHGPLYDYNGNVPDHPKNAGRKDDSQKPDLSAIAYHPKALAIIAKVLDYGAERYGRDNYRKVPGLEKRYPAAIIRHLFAHLRGEKLDPESGLPHLAHIACSVLFLLEVDNES